MDTGATCAFVPTDGVIDPTIVCTDDGLVPVTLRVDDGVLAPSTDDALVTIDNADPTVVIDAPLDGASYEPGVAVALTASITDAGANDTHTCQIDWGDGTVEPATIGGATCTGSHGYATAGDYTVTVTATDDDGNDGAASVDVTVEVLPVNDRPTSTGGTATTNVGIAVVIDLGPLAADLETGDADLTYTITDAPDHGILSGSGPTFTYAPTAGYAGPDAFSYTVTDRGDPDGCTPVARYCTAPLTSEPAEVVSIAIIDTGPEPEAGGPYSGVEGAQIALDGVAVDAENPSPTILWTSTPLAGVDAGATCTFTPSVTVADPSVACTDDGTWTLRLSIDDGVNQPATDIATLTVTNARPSVDISAPAAGTQVATGVALNLSAAVGDVGANDTLTCSIAWGDGTTTTGVIAAGVCTGSHPYAGIGSRTITVTLTDDDGGSATASVTITVTNQPPDVVVDPPAATPEGVARALNATVTDSDGPSMTATWSAIAGAGVDTGAQCTFTGADPIDRTVRCDDDGTWTLRLAVNDGANLDVVRTVTLTVGNQPPVVSIASPTVGATPAPNTQVSVTAPFTDAGSHDTHTCQIAWGDGTTTTGVIATGSCTGSRTYPTPGARTITVTVTDDDSGNGTASVAIDITPPPPPPVVDAGSNRTTDEGTTITLDGTVTNTPPSAAQWLPVVATGSPAPDVGWACQYAGTNPVDRQVTCTDDGGFALTLEATNAAGTRSDAMVLTVKNVAPTIAAPTLAPDVTAASPAHPGTPITLQATIADRGWNDTPTCTIDWGDGNAGVAGAIAVGAQPGTWTCTRTHTYTDDGTFTARNRTIKVQADDLDGGKVTVQRQITVDPCTWRGTSGADNHNGTAGNDVLCGLGGDDRLNGLGGADVLVGGDGNDILTGGPSSDRLLGGNGTDRAMYTDATAGVVVDLATGSSSGGGLGADELVSIEDAFGGPQDDTLRGSAGVNELWGDAGADTLDGREGPDTLRGGEGRDILAGRLGDDALFGDGDSDLLDADEGNDILYGGTERDVLLGGPGNDLMAGDVGSDPTDSVGDADHLNGGSGNDILYGQGGSDCSSTFAGQPGCTAGNLIQVSERLQTDYYAQMNGGPGQDKLHGGPGTDRLDGGPEGGNELVGGADQGDFCSFGPVGAADKRDPSCETPTKTPDDRKAIAWDKWKWRN